MKAARRIADGAPLAHRFHRKALRRLADPRPLSKAELDSELDYADSEDYMAGYNAFKNRDKPKFRGR
jgi:enoyl-CoA hydratase